MQMTLTFILPVQGHEGKASKLVERSGGIGLGANVIKSKDTRNKHAMDAPITIRGNPIDTAQDLVYLGSLVTPDGDS